MSADQYRIPVALVTSSESGRVGLARNLSLEGIITPIEVIDKKGQIQADAEVMLIDINGESQRDVVVASVVKKAVRTEALLMDNALEKYGDITDTVRDFEKEFLKR